MPYAVSAGARMVRERRPDLIFASGPPFTSLLAGYALHKRCRVPWVAELRDRWTDDPYYPPPWWRLAYEAHLERRILGTARGLVTVSQPWADAYADTYPAPTVAIYNGFDPKDYGASAPATVSDRETLCVVYTGRIYPGRRDPTPLFVAMQSLRDRVHVRAEFYGSIARHVLPLAARFDVADRVAVHDAVSYRESIRLQRCADVLLLLQWNDPAERGNVPGKLFEYFGAGRPILGFGPEDGVPARMIGEHDAGLVTNDPAVVAHKLEEWAAIKASTGSIPPLAARVRQTFTRDQQYRRLTAFLQQLVASEETADYGHRLH